VAAIGWIKQMKFECTFKIATNPAGRSRSILRVPSQCAAQESRENMANVTVGQRWIHPVRSHWTITIVGLYRSISYRFLALPLVGGFLSFDKFRGKCRSWASSAVFPHRV